MRCEGVAAMTSRQELDRRREILQRAIGESVAIKRDTLKRGHCLRNRRGVLSDVRRTRCTILFDDVGEWTVPIAAVWLPFSLEPLPGQLSLFAVQEGQP